MNHNRVRRRTIRRSMRLIAVLAALVSAAPLRSVAAQAPIPMLAGMSASASSLRDSIVALARAQIGTRYRHGGASPQRGFDCSGVVQYVMARFAMIVPRTAKQQAAVRVPVARGTSLLRPGDQRRRPGHRESVKPGTRSEDQGLARRGTNSVGGRD